MSQGDLTRLLRTIRLPSLSFSLVGISTDENYLCLINCGKFIYLPQELNESTGWKNQEQEPTTNVLRKCYPVFVFCLCLFQSLLGLMCNIELSYCQQNTEVGLKWKNDYCQEHGQGWTEKELSLLRNILEFNRNTFMNGGWGDES